MSPRHASLAELKLLLERHGEAARDGDADALAACAEPIRQRVAALARHPDPFEPGEASVLRQLVRECVRNQALLARRQQATGRSLAALCAGAADSAPIYGMRGTLAAPSRSGRGFGRA